MRHGTSSGAETLRLRRSRPEGEDDCQQRWCEQDSPEGDDDAQRYGAEEGSPPWNLRRAVQDIGAYDKAFKDAAQAVETEYQAKTPFVMPTEGNCAHWTDEGDHPREGESDLEQA